MAREHTTCPRRCERRRAKSSARSPRRIAAALTEYWSPRVIAELDQSYVKVAEVAKVRGMFGSHQHADEDELLLILEGTLRIEMETESVTLDEGDLFVVPAGVRHNPSAEGECLVMLVEQKTTLHAGTEPNDKARTLSEQLRPL